MRIPARRAAALAVLALWVVAVGMHVRREYFKSESVRLEEATRALGPGSYFYSVRMAGSTIGVASSRLDTAGVGFVFEDIVTLDVPAMDTVHRAVVRTRAELTRALSLHAFSFTLSSEVGDFSVKGAAAGDSVLELEVGAGASPQRSSIRLDPGVILPVALPLRLAAAGELRAGRRLSVRVFDPSTLASRVVEVFVAGLDTLIVPDSANFDAVANRWLPATWDTVPAWRIEERMGGVAVASWLDAEGRLVKAESPLGFVLERTAYELAQAEWERSRADPRASAGYGDVIERTAVASNVALEAGRPRDVLRVRLLGVELDGFDLEGGRQSLRGDTLIVRRETAVWSRYRLPYRGVGGPADELVATPLIQADDARIIAQAREIADGSTDPLDVATRLTQWVYRSIEKDITLSVPSALQVLEARAGDCNEHTVLYVALARALGLPARTAVGLVYVRGSFYYHAWPEVWLGNDWVAVDPTFGQVPADASHLRFLVGGLARQIELVRLIGRLRLEVI